LIKYRTHYFDDPIAKASFKGYAETVFGLNFSLWESKGLWDNEQYIPFSAFDDETCIASICVYPVEITIDGRKERWAQLLTVGSLPEYRGQGLHYELWSRAKDWIKQNCKLTFLFTNDDTIGFYKKLGFKHQQEYFDSITLDANDDSFQMLFRKLNLKEEKDYSLATRLAHRRIPVSEKLGYYNPNLLLFMLLYPYSDWLYYIGPIDAIIIVQQEEDKIRIHDIIAEKMPSFNSLKGFLLSFGKESIDFLFCTDQLNLPITTKHLVENSPLMVTQNFNYSSDYLFPFSIRA